MGKEGILVWEREARMPAAAWLTVADGIAFGCISGAVAERIYGVITAPLV